MSANSKKNVLKISELNQLFAHIATLETDDQQAFARDVQHIRAQMKSEEDPWAE